MISAFLLLGLGLRRDREWRRYSAYSLVARLITLVFVALLFMSFAPGTLLGPLQIGGLMERILAVFTLFRYVVFGWRLYQTRTEK